MTNDPTTILIRRIQVQAVLGPYLNALDLNTATINSADTLLGTAANYAQMIGTLSGPIAQFALSGLIPKVIPALTNSSDAAALLTTNQYLLSLEVAKEQAGNDAITAAAAGLVAGILVFELSLLLALLADSTGSSSDIGALTQLETITKDILNVTLRTYWQQQINDAIGNLNPPGSIGGVGTYLNNLCAQGPTSLQAQRDVGGYLNAGQNLVDNLVPAYSGSAFANWERPVVQSEGFSVNLIEYVSTTPARGLAAGWYGPVPNPILTGDGSVSDPRTLLSVILLAIKGYITLMLMAPIVDPVGQLTFDKFIESYKSFLAEYFNFIKSNFQLSVNGIVKTDLPSPTDIGGFVSYRLALYKGGDGIQSQIDYGSQFSGDGNPGQVGPLIAGNTWNGIYGAVETYPPYGSYRPSPPIPVPCSAPSCIIEVLGDGFVNDFIAKGIILGTPELPASISAITPWATNVDWFTGLSPLGAWAMWLQNRLILGRMARWKAIYLINCYDKVYSALQRLEIIVNSAPGANNVQLNTVTLNDGTIADGNWHSVEICKSLRTVFINNILIPNQLPPFVRHYEGIYGYSLFLLATALAGLIEPYVGAQPPAQANPGKRPLSFRACLSVAAL